jgi:hypothetical protein
MPDLILCEGCGDFILDIEDRLHTETGDWHFDCWLERSDVIDDEDDDD